MLDIVPPEKFFRKIVDEKFESFLGPGILRKPEVKRYAVGLLREFAFTDKIHPTYADQTPITTLDALLADADPVFGTAASFIQEWERRRYIASLILFFLGMYPDGAPHFALWKGETPMRLRDIALESYYILSQFNLFEYEDRSKFFALLANGKRFDLLVEGFNQVSIVLKPMLPR